MKLLCFIAFGLICGLVGVNAHLLGARECTWGPTYWCQNITNAKSCGAVKHCIQTVWEHQQLPPDNDNVCNICLEMVKEARDQLESNETQEELREVFEGSCKLIPIKLVSKECCKLADDFIPELVETLASQMNPQVVCSVAGLCNNAWVDKQLEDMKAGKEVVEDATGKDMVKATPLKNATDVSDDCSGCKVVINALDKRMQTMTRDEVLNNMLLACGRTGSLSDGCSAVIITYFNELYKFLQKNFKASGVCHIAGVCAGSFHSHRPVQKNVEIVHESDVGVVKPKDDLPCELCEQLVVHLRDILIANTTEQEFEQVLHGLCKQTGSFKEECLSIVNEYYAIIYDFLVNNLNPGEVCKLCGLCGNPGFRQGPIWPLIPADTVKTLQATILTPSDDTIKAIPLTPAKPVDSNRIPATRLTAASNIAGKDEAAGLHRVSIGDNGGVVKVINEGKAQLPIERMFPQTAVYVQNKQACTFCEYFLHYVQQIITSPSTEEAIEKVVREGCDHLPASIKGQCREFIATYGNAFIALFAQEIDPSQVCPKLGLCPSEETAVALDANHVVNDKPTCPLCLLAVQSLVNRLKDKKTEEDIRRELDNLCTDLPQSLSGECRNFVDTYSEELVDMLIADFTPEEICTYLKLCDPTEKKINTTPVPDILSNEIPPLPSEMKSAAKNKTKKSSIKDSTGCVICEFVLSKIDDELKNNATEEEIKELVKEICSHLPKSVNEQCVDFVNEYGDMVIALLAQSLDPKEVCAVIHLCSKAGLKHPMILQSIKKSVKDCAVCEAAMSALDELLGDPSMQKDIEKLLKKVCPKLPTEDQEECNEMIDAYGPSIMNLISHVAEPRVVCMEIGLCRWEKQSVKLLGGKKCVWGPAYWCQSVAHAKSCDTLEHCQEKVWKSKKPVSTSMPSF